MAKKYLTLEEAANMLGVSTEDLVKARENGDIRGFADRGSWKFRQNDLDEFARSRQADSDPDMQLLSDSVLDDDFTDLSSSDSDVRLAVDDSLLPDLGESTSDVRLAGSDDDILGTSSSDVRLMGDSGPSLDASDSDVQLVGSDSDSDVRVSDSDSDVRISGQIDTDSDIQVDSDSDSDVRLTDSDSDVELVPESDSDVKLMEDSDSDVQLIEGLDATDGEIVLSDDTDSVEINAVSYTTSPSPRDQRGSRMPSSA